MARHSRSTVWGALFLTPLLVNLLSAQVHGDFGLTLGYYRPVGSFEPTEAIAVSLPTNASDKAGPSIGAQGRLWLNRRFGVALELARASSTVPRRSTPDGPVGPSSVRVLMVAAHGIYALSSTSRRLIWVSAGAGLVHHGGAAYKPYNSPTELAGTIGVGWGHQVRARLGFTLGLTTYLYSHKVTSRFGPTVERGFQVDPILQAGLTWSWRSRGGA